MGSLDEGEKREFGSGWQSIGATSGQNGGFAVMRVLTVDRQVRRCVNGYTATAGSGGSVCCGCTSNLHSSRSARIPAYTLL